MWNPRAVVHVVTRSRDPRSRLASSTAAACAPCSHRTWGRGRPCGGRYPHCAVCPPLQGHGRKSSRETAGCPPRIQDKTERPTKAACESHRVPALQKTIGSELPRWEFRESPRQGRTSFSDSQVPRNGVLRIRASLLCPGPDPAREQGTPTSEVGHRDVRP